MKATWEIKKKLLYICLAIKVGFTFLQVIVLSLCVECICQRSTGQIPDIIILGAIS